MKAIVRLPSEEKQVADSNMEGKLGWKSGGRGASRSMLQWSRQA